MATLPLSPPPVPDHCSSTFKYFLSISSSSIKNTKTILRAYVRDIDGVYRRLSTAKNAGKQLSTSFFAALTSANAVRNKIKKVNKILTKILPGEFIIL